MVKNIKSFFRIADFKGLITGGWKYGKITEKNKNENCSCSDCRLYYPWGTGTAYAANVGGIQRTVQIWLHGDQTQATLDVSNDGTYTMEYYNEDGTLHQTGGGGVSIDADGTQRALTAEELMEKSILLM